MRAVNEKTNQKCWTRTNSSDERRYRFKPKSITPFCCIQYIDNAYEEIKKGIFSLIYFSENHRRRMRRRTWMFVIGSGRNTEWNARAEMSVCVCSEVPPSAPLLSIKYAPCSVQIGLAVSFFYYMLFWFSLVRRLCLCVVTLFCSCQLSWDEQGSGWTSLRRSSLHSFDSAAAASSLFVFKEMLMVK